jgi:hypothetical protein
VSASLETRDVRSLKVEPNVATSGSLPCRDGRNNHWIG